MPGGRWRFLKNTGGKKNSLVGEKLLLVGYRTQRPQGENLSQPLARLMDIASRLSDTQLKLMVRFADFLVEIEMGSADAGSDR